MSERNTRRTHATGLVLGVLFGFWLSWTRFVSYDVILGGLTFQSFYLWFMFATGVGTAMVGLQVAKRFRTTTWLTDAPLSWPVLRPAREHVVGSVIFGIGWAVAGACPGPAIAQVGRGQLAGLFTLSGIFGGVVAAGWLRDRLQKGKQSRGPEICGEVQEGAALEARSA